MLTARADGEAQSLPAAAARLEEGRRALAEDRLRDAERAANEVLAEAPPLRGPALLLRGEVALALGHGRLARTQLDEARRLLPPGDRAAPRLLRRLGEAHLRLGELDAAAALLEGARGAGPGAKDPPDPEEAAALLCARARLSAARGQPAAAEAQLASAERLLGDRGARPLAEVLAQRGALLAQRGALAEAEAALGRARALYRQLQLDVPLPVIRLLARLRLERRDEEGAAALLRAALSPDQMMSTAPARVDLARLSLRAGRRSEGLALLDTALAAAQAYIEALRQEGMSKEEALGDGLGALQAGADLLWTLLWQRPDEPGLAGRGVAAALLVKGRTLEEAQGGAAALHRGLDDEGRALLRELRDLRGRIADLTLRRADAALLAPLEDRAAALSERLESQVRPLGYQARSAYAMPRYHALRESLPPDAALLEVVAFSPDAALAGAGARRRYLGFLLHRDQEPLARDLGPDVDERAAQLRAALARPERPAAAVTVAATALAAQGLGELLRAVPAGVTRLYLSLDGALQLVPFAVLDDGRGPLLDRYRLVGLSSARDLLPARDDPPPVRGAVVVAADPAFAGGALALPPLPGTRAEAEALRALFPGAQLLLGAAASREALLSLQAPGVLHIATHGFYLADPAPPPPAGRGLRLQAAAPLPDPLLRSALALAGASPPGPAGLRGQGLLTAREIAGMELLGTQLVVLSACETGLGELRRGQGVYGLRHAVLAAGAESLLVSLWRVDDQATAAFMTALYRALLGGSERSAALQEAARAVRARWPHPYYWAPFFLIGADGPLRGVAPAPAPLGPPAPLRALAPRGWSKVRDVDGLTRIWGTGPDEVWFSGTRGQVLGFDGGELHEVPGIGAGREVVGLGAAGGARFAATHSPTLVYRYEDGALREVDPWFFRGLTLRFAALIDGEDGALHLLGRSGSDEWWALRNDGRGWSRRPQVIAGSERIASLQPWPAPGAPGALGLTTERLRLVAGRWRRDGDEPVPLLARTGITAVARGGDGALWVGGQVYHERDGFLCRVRDERWSCVRFPRGVTALSARGDELLVAWTAPGRVLLGSGSARRLPRGPQDLSVQLRERPLTLQPEDEPPERSTVRAIFQPPAGPPGEAWALTGEAIWYRRP